LVLTQQQPIPRVTNKNTADEDYAMGRGARTCPACALAGAGGQRSPTDLSHAGSALIEALPPAPTAGAGPDYERTQTFPAPVSGGGQSSPLAGHTLQYVASLASKGAQNVSIIQSDPFVLL
jgi:hypothetical protein